MDLKELVPQVPQDVPELKPGDTGIYVVTLQLWLKMLEYDCGQVDGIFGNKVKEQVKKLKSKETEAETITELVDLATWKKMDALLRGKLPPDPETLERLPFPKKNEYETEEAYQYAIKKGLERFGFQIDVLKGIHYLEIDESGVGLLEQVPPGIYELEMVEQTGDVQEAQTTYQEDLGSLEVRLFDEQEKPVSGKVKLTNCTPDPGALRKAIRLFKALYRELDVLEDKHGNEVNPEIINTKLDDADARAWQEFPISWGKFFGAPWMGVMFDSVTNDSLTFPSENDNWTSYETALMLYQWGEEHIKTKTNQDYRPVAVRHLNHCYGGLINNRLDFSQTGRAVSLQLPRKTSRQVDGKDTGQDYGLIDYQSPEYHRPSFELMFTSQLRIDSDYQVKCPDKELIAGLFEKEELLTEGDMVWNSYLGGNAEVGKVSSRHIRILIRFQFYIDEKDKDYSEENPIVNQYVERTFPVNNAAVVITDVNGEKMDLRTGTIKSNKGKIEAVETNFYGTVKLPKKYLKKDKNDPRAPYTIAITTSDQQEVKKKITTKLKDQLIFNAIGTHFDYAADSVEEGLYEFKNNQWYKLPGKQAYTQHKSLLDEEFITGQLFPGLKAMYHLDEDQQVEYGQDDEYDPPVRDHHYGIDIGTRVYQKDEGKYRSFGKGIKVFPILESGYVRTAFSGFDSETNEYFRLDIKQKVCFEKEKFRLVLLLRYGHIHAPEDLLMEWTGYSKWSEERSSRSIGILFTLEPLNLWNGKVPPFVTNDDPEVNAAMKKKGNHIHFHIEGIFDRKTGLDGNETYNKERKTFYNGILLPEIIKRTNEYED